MNLYYPQAFLDNAMDELVKAYQATPGDTDEFSCKLANFLIGLEATDYGYIVARAMLRSGPLLTHFVQAGYRWVYFNEVNPGRTYPHA